MKPVAPVLTRRALLRAALVTPLLPGLALGQSANGCASLGEGTMMKIRVAFADQDFTATLDDNVSAGDFASMLPLELTISDFSNNEKIAYLPRKLNEEARGPFPDAAPGDLCYYVPWGNLAFFTAATKARGISSGSAASMVASSRCSRAGNSRCASSASNSE